MFCDDHPTNKHSFKTENSLRIFNEKNTRQEATNDSSDFLIFLFEIKVKKSINALAVGRLHKFFQLAAEQHLSLEAEGGKEIAKSSEKTMLQSKLFEALQKNVRN